MSDAIELSQPYDTRDRAAICGYRKVMIDSNAWHLKEFGFWVILKAHGKEVKYHYSTPKSDGSNTNVKLKWPTGHIVRAFCHTHPKSISTGDFSADDLGQFRELLKKGINIAFYLMNPYQEIRLAENETDFMQGKSVSWQ